MNTEHLIMEEAIKRYPSDGIISEPTKRVLIARENTERLRKRFIEAATFGASLMDAQLSAKDKEIAELKDALQKSLSYFADLNGCDWIENESIGGKDMNQRAASLQKIIYNLKKQYTWQE